MYVFSHEQHNGIQAYLIKTFLIMFSMQLKHIPLLRSLFLCWYLVVFERHWLRNWISIFLYIFNNKLYMCWKLYNIHCAFFVHDLFISKLHVVILQVVLQICVCNIELSKLLKRDLSGWFYSNRNLVHLFHRILGMWSL